MLQSLAFLCGSAIVFSQLAGACAFSWLCPAGCAQHPQGPWLTFLSLPTSGQGTASQKMELWRWERGYYGVVMTVRLLLYGQKGLWTATLPNSRGVCRVWSLVCASQIRTKGYLYDALPHLSICLTPQIYLTATWEEPHEAFVSSIFWLSACKATDFLCYEHRLCSAENRGGQETVSNIILDTTTELK